MKHKIQPIEIPEDDPFKFDALDRRQAVESLAALIDALEGPFVLAINSPWGTGKTILIQILQKHLEGQGYKCLYFDAWKTDFSADPLVAFLGELGSLSSQLAKDKTDFEEYFGKAKKIATLIAKKALPVAGKIATAGLLDLNAFTEQALSELAADTIGDFVDAYEAEKSLNGKFHDFLKKAVDQLTATGEKEQIVIFVDELDRCRPTYAIELLERVKHLFDIENVIFVLSLDKQQLGVSLGAVYGNGINSEEYLRRFIDLEYILPKPGAEAYTENLFQRFGFDDFFTNRTAREFAYDQEHLNKTFSDLSDVFNLNLRAREQCCTRISVAMLTTPSKNYIYPDLLTALVVLKEASPDVYKRYVLEGGTASEVLKYMRRTDAGAEFLFSHDGTVLEAYLIAAKHQQSEDSIEIEEYQKIMDDPSADETLKTRAKRIIGYLRDMSMRDKSPPLSYVVNKIELAVQYKR